MFKKKVNENKIWGMPCVVDHQNKMVYIKCSSAITAMGVSQLVEKHHPGYKGEFVSLEYLEKLRDQLAN